MIDNWTNLCIFVYEVTKKTENTKSNNMEKPVTEALDFKQCRYVLRLIVDNNLPFVWLSRRSTEARCQYLAFVRWPRETLTIRNCKYS